MRFEWLLAPLLALSGFAPSAQELVRVDAGDQLAALTAEGAPTQLLLRTRQVPVDLAYDVRRVRAVPPDSPRYAPALSAGRADPSLNALGLPLHGDGALVDLYPFREGFRITAGARADLSDARFVSRSRRSMSESDRVVAATWTGRDDGFAPYLGIGYGRRMLDGRLEVAVDAGILFDRERESGGSGDGAAALAVGTGAERREVSEDGTSSDVYPVLGFSMKYQF